MYIYMTKPGDNIEKVAQLFYDNVSRELISRILTYNARRMAVTMFGDQYHLMPYYPLYLPDFSDEISDVLERKAMRTIEFWPAHVRMKVTHLMKMGMSFESMVDLIRLSEASKAAVGHKTPEGGGNAEEGGAAAFVTGVLKEGSARVLEHAEANTDRVVESLEHLHESTLQYVNTYEITKAFKPRAVARASFKAAHANTMKVLNKRLRTSMYGRKKTAL